MVEIKRWYPIEALSDSSAVFYAVVKDGACLASQFISEFYQHDPIEGELVLLFFEWMLSDPPKVKKYLRHEPKFAFPGNRSVKSFALFKCSELSDQSKQRKRDLGEIHVHPIAFRLACCCLTKNQRPPLLVGGGYRKTDDKATQEVPERMAKYYEVAHLTNLLRQASLKNRTRINSSVLKCDVEFERSIFSYAKLRKP